MTKSEPSMDQSAKKQWAQFMGSLLHREKSETLLVEKEFSDGKIDQEPMEEVNSITYPSISS